MSFVTYLKELSSSVRSTNGRKLATLLCLRDMRSSPFTPRILFSVSNGEHLHLLQTHLSDLSDSWSDVVCSFLNALILYQKEDFSGCSLKLFEMVSPLSSLFEYWNRSVIRQFSTDMKHVVFLTNSTKLIEDSVPYLSRFVQACNADKSPHTENKQWVSLHLTNVLFSIYFKTNALGLTKSLMRPFEGNRVSTIPLDSFCTADIVTYRYYSGRIYLYQGQYHDAYQRLSFCFARIPQSDIKRKTLVLYYLTLVSLLFGRSPSKSVLDSCHLGFLTALIQAVRNGDLQSYRSFGLEYRRLLLKTGTFMLYSKLDTTLFRNLFKYITCLKPTNKFHFSYIQKAVFFQQPEPTLPIQVGLTLRYCAM
ncbi:hypothetical protein GEMRC1_007861 [Eukaryota sp. GEM-RC1]